MSKADLQPLSRFSSRVGDYVRFRPSYPPALLDHLAAQAGLGPGAAVADVGAGTGIFSALLLDRGARVFAVEPNQPMRQAAEAALGDRPNFVSVDGRSDATTLAAASVGLITCAQAFHWFEPAETAREFRRILRPAGACALIWNTPLLAGTGFAEGYEAIKARFGTDYQRVRHENQSAPGVLTPFFGHAGWTKFAFPNVQHLDLPGLKGRLLSSSYAPQAGQANYGPMLAALEQLFGRFARDGRVAMAYTTELFLGRFA